MEFDDALTEKYLGGEEISLEELKKTLRKGVIANGIYPVLCGTALQNVGVQLALDAVCDYLPSPLDVPQIEGSDVKDETKKIIIKADEKEPFAGIAFKVATDPFVGKLCFVRVYSGVLSSGSYVLNASTGNKERIGRLVRMHANHREEIKEIKAGDIAAVIGLKDTTTGNTLCDKHPVLLESLLFLSQLLKLLLNKTKADQEKMGVALGRLAEEDPTFRVESDETGQV